jgi:hypothetical protein
MIVSFQHIPTVHSSSIFVLHTFIIVPPKYALAMLQSCYHNVPHVEVDHTVAPTKLLGSYLDAHTLNYTNHQSLLVFVIRDTSCIHNTAKARLSQKGMRRWVSGRPRASTANPFQRKVMSVVIGATVWSISAWGMLHASNISTTASRIYLPNPPSSS